MNPEQLLQHFDRISEAPDAIPRLRRFILDLAVRGKLVEQDPNDEPASELLKRIQMEKSITTSRGRPIPEDHQSYESHCIPKNWSCVSLITLGYWAIGTGFPKNEQGLSSGPYFFLKVSDMNLPGNEKYITTAQNFIDDDAAKRIRVRFHPAGTIIFPKIGGAIATNKRRILSQESAFDNNCLGITFSKELNIEWAYLLLTSLDFTKYQAGTAVPALQQGVLERIEVHVPPIAEQHRIVAKVDELMALCDRLQAAQTEREQNRDRLVAASLHRLHAPEQRRRPGRDCRDPDFRDESEASASAFPGNWIPPIPAGMTGLDEVSFVLENLPRLTTRPAHIKQLRQTILNLAVRGKLVPQDPNDEPASSLLEEIVEEKKKLIKEGCIGRQKQYSEIALEEKLFITPTGWHWARLDTLFNVIVDCPHSTPTFTDSGFLCIDTNSFKQGAFVESRFRYVNANTYEERIARLTPDAGDIVFAREGSVGESVVLPSGIRCCLGQRVMLFRPSKRLNSEFLRLSISSPLSLDALLKLHKGIGAKHVNVGDMRHFAVALPPAAEQHRIVAKVDELMALCDQLEARLADTAADSRRLLEAVLHEALLPAGQAA